MKIQISEHTDLPACGDGCCHDHGLYIEIINGEDAIYLSNDPEHITKICNLFQQLFGEDNVNIKLISRIK